MKRFLLIVMLMFMLCGCSKEESKDTPDVSSTTTTTTESTTTTMTTMQTTTKSKEEQLIGKFKEKAAKGTVPSEIEFKKNNKFSMTLNLCEGMGTITGTYKVSKNTIILSFKAGQFSGFAGDDLTSLKFKINSMNSLTFISDSVCCGPFKNNKYTRK